MGTSSSRKYLTCFGYGRNKFTIACKYFSLFHLWWWYLVRNSQGQGWASDSCDTWTLWLVATHETLQSPWKLGFECFWMDAAGSVENFTCWTYFCPQGGEHLTFLLTLAGRRAGFEADKAVFPKPAITPFVAVHQHGLFWIKIIPVLGCSWLVCFSSLCLLPNQRTPSLDGTGQGGSKMPQQCAVFCLPALVNLPGALPCVCCLLSHQWHCKSS